MLHCLFCLVFLHLACAIFVPVHETVLAATGALVWQGDCGHHELGVLVHLSTLEVLAVERLLLRRLPEGGFRGDGGGGEPSLDTGRVPHTHFRSRSLMPWRRNTQLTRSRLSFAFAYLLSVGASYK